MGNPIVETIPMMDAAVLHRERDGVAACLAALWDNTFAWNCQLYHLHDIRPQVKRLRTK